MISVENLKDVKYIKVGLNSQAALTNWIGNEMGI